MNTPLISVTTPVGQAIERVKHVLFRPFDLTRWFVIGFGAWLAGLGQRGGGYNYRFNSGRGAHMDLQAGVERARDYVAGNLHWLVPLAAVLVVFLFGLWVLFTWLSSRGQFMFLHQVALNRAEVAIPWTRFARQANSLFGFRLLLGLAQLAVTLPILFLGAIRAYHVILDSDWKAGDLLAFISIGFGVILISLVFGIVSKLTGDFVVPVMFLRGKTCLAGWAELGPLLAAHVGPFILYFLFQFVLAIAIVLVVLLAVLVTCCLAACLLILPYVGTVTLLPVLVFLRAYSLHFFAQFGADFDVFAIAAPTPLTPPPLAAPPPGGPPPISDGVAGI